MKNVEFSSNIADRIYKDYLKRVEYNSKILSDEDKKEILMEINSHIYEGMQNTKGDNESDKLLTIIEKLGAPEDFMKPILAEKKINEATRTFKPKDVYMAIVLNLRNGIIYSVFALLYFLLTVFGLLIISKILFPTKTGLFYIGSEFHSFGFVMNSAGMNEILGYWYYPIVVASAIIFYLIITLLFRFLRVKK